MLADTFLRDAFTDAAIEIARTDGNPDLAERIANTPPGDWPDPNLYAELAALTPTSGTRQLDRFSELCQERMDADRAELHRNRWRHYLIGASRVLELFPRPTRLRR